MMTYSLSKHGEFLKNALEEYSLTHKTKPENDEDAKAFAAQSKLLQEIVRLIAEIGNTWNLVTKKKMGKELDDLNKTTFPQDEIPEIKGIKSLEFARMVFIPNLKKSLEIEYGVLVPIMNAMGIHVEEKKQHTQSLIDKLEDRIKKYIAEHSNLASVSLFAESEKGISIAIKEVNFKSHSLSS